MMVFVSVSAVWLRSYELISRFLLSAANIFSAVKNDKGKLTTKSTAIVTATLYSQRLQTARKKPAWLQFSSRLYSDWMGFARGREEGKTGGRGYFAGVARLKRSTAKLVGATVVEKVRPETARGDSTGRMRSGLSRVFSASRSSEMRVVRVPPETVWFFFRPSKLKR